MSIFTAYKTVEFNSRFNELQEQLVIFEKIDTFRDKNVSENSEKTTKKCSFSKLSSRKFFIFLVLHSEKMMIIL